MLKTGRKWWVCGRSGKTSLKRKVLRWTLKDVWKCRKEREGHSSCRNSLGKGFGYRNESYLFRDSDGTNMY